MQENKSSWLHGIMPGLLVAATGVGAGDLANAAFAGQKYGYALLWAVVFGAFLKFALNEGLARYQLARGETLLEGGVRRYGRIFALLFLFYLVTWSFFVGRALLNACGASLAALLPAFESPHWPRILAILQGIVALLIVQKGSFKSFERLMCGLVFAMFAIVVATACALLRGGSELLLGLVPGVPQKAGPEGFQWSLAVLGGVGGTLTVLAYGYWIREEGLRGLAALPRMRRDLALSYSVTALFGLSMMVIGTEVQAAGKSLSLLVQLGERLGERFGEATRLLFLAGVCGAVFSSLLGVLQSVPYLFADLFYAARGEKPPEARALRRSKAYRVYALALTFVPMLGLFTSFERAQKAYGMVGASILPVLALLLIDLLAPWRKGSGKNGPLATGTYVFALLLFLWMMAEGVLPS